MATLTGGPVGYTEPSTPPGAELGAVTQQTGGLHGWAAFVDEAEFVPELAWPTSRDTYHRMRSDSQVDALHIGTVQPIREFRWSIDPNGAPASMVEQAARDLGLPIKGHEDDDIPISSNRFTFDDFIGDALLAPLYGHFYFEIVGDIRGDEWHMVKLAPRHPRTIMQFQANTVGDLLGIQQNIGGAAGWNRMPPPIPASKLVSLVWRREGGSHVGRSLLRSIYREWMVKDRTIRVAAINLERGGGVPAIIGPQGASDDQLRDLAQLARQFKVAEGGGGAIPFGSRLELVGGHTPDAISLLKYCDECMARVWMLMLVQLGMTTTGNRALGAEFAIYAARAQRSMAKGLIQSPINDFLERYAAWNDPFALHAPRLHFENAKPESMSIADFVALIEAKALHVAPADEEWLRDEGGLPKADPGALEKAFAADALSRLPPPVDPQVDPATAQTPTLARGADPNSRGAIRASLTLPDRPLRRQPNDTEVRAGVDFRGMDQAHSSVLEQAKQLFQGQVIPGQIAALASQIQGLTDPTPDELAKVTAPTMGADDLSVLLAQAARSGANAAIGELAAQGAPATSAPEDAVLAALVADQAQAVAAMAANGLSLAAQRKAASLASQDGRTAEDIAAAVQTHLGGMKHQWTMDQLQGAVTMAQNAGRFEVFGDAQAQDVPLSFEASELLDSATCGPCIQVDGKHYDTLAQAMLDYPTGGYFACEGGPRCRGTAVAVFAEQDPSSSAHPLLSTVARAPTVS